MGMMYLPPAEKTLPGRDTEMPILNRHAAHGRPIAGAFQGKHKVLLGMGCFWGAERRFWSQPGVYTTAAGYAGGTTRNPTYREVCSGLTGHTEVVLVVFDPGQTDLKQLLRVFFESHDPTQGMRQGNDLGTQYRSAIYVDTAADKDTAEQVRMAYQLAFQAAGRASVTTEIAARQPFFYAEDEHQQYLHKNPGGYCGLKGTGVTCAI